MDRSHRAARGFLQHGDIDVRPMRKDEADTLAGTGFRSFRALDAAAWRQRVFALDGNPLLAADDTLVARIDGRIAGHASGYRFTMSLGGRDVPVRGIAAVAVVPEFRRRGVAEALMVALHRQMRRRGEPLSMLYAFRNSFYRKMGYGTVEWVDDLRVSAEQLPASPLRRHVRALDREKDATVLPALYERWRQDRVGPFVRHPGWWERRVWERTSDGAVYVDPKTKRPRGYLLYEVPVDPPYPRQQLFLREIVALDSAAFRGLIGYLEALGDQFRWMSLPFPRGEGVTLLRLVDVPAALALHPAPARNGARGRIGLDLADPVVAANARGLDVSFGARGAKAAPGRAARDRIAMPVDRLAQVYLGGASARALLEQGFATGSPRAAALLDRAFTGPPCYLSPLNGF
jgi:predicted N-acetyltransferase YhbS